MTVAERASQLLERGGFPERLRKSALAQLVECNPSHVTRLLQRGVIPEAAVVGQLVDTRLALQGIVRSTDPARAGEAPTAPDLLAPSATVLPKDGDSFAAIRSRKELAIAQQRELELDREAGRLVEKDAVTRAIEDQVRAVTQGLMQIPSRVSEQLAAESDPNRCRKIVEHAIKGELTNLSRGMHDYVDGLDS